MHNSNLDKILPLVQRPGRYTDNELNSIHKNWDQAQVKIALTYPDLYEIGMSGLGLAILYSVVNRLPQALADRSYLPWPDMEEAMRRNGIPLFGWETRRELREFDILGITLQTELCYAGALNLLDLAGLPLYSDQRNEGHPLVIGGGSCCANPAPLSKFFDAFVIGDGEEAIVEICESLRNSKSETRNTKLQRLATISGVYVPVIHDKNKAKIKARHVSELKYEYAAHPPLVPLVEVTHDRLMVEIARGCTRGCRFCQAGMVYRPRLVRPAEDVVKLAKDGIAQSGWDEVSLLSLSSGDYPDLLGLLQKLNGCFSVSKVAISLPSLRLDSFDGEMIKALKKVKKTGLTFAPEAGSQRLRDVINKGISKDELLRVIALAKKEGWMQVKLYFMIGLPTETEEDLKELCDLCHQASRLGVNLKVSVSPFVPKSQTPFQWEAQDNWETLQQKIDFLSRGLKSHKIQMKWHDLRSSKLEGLLSRGDSSLAPLIEKAWHKGARLDQWSEHFVWGCWEEAMRELGLDLNDLCRARDADEVLPWDNIDYGVSKKFLLQEKQKAYEAKITGDCRELGCQGCGADCGIQGTGNNEQLTKNKEQITVNGKKETVNSRQVADGFGRSARKMAGPAPLARTKFRLRYAKGPELRFISHLDLMRAWLRAISRAELPVAFSQGFSPHPKLAFGPPLALGLTSSADYMDIQLDRPMSEDIGLLINMHLPPGLKVLESKPIFGKAKSITELCDAAEYRVVSATVFDPQAAVQKARGKLSDKKPWPVNILRKDQHKELDLAPQILDVSAEASSLTIKMRLVEGGVKLNETLAAMLELPEGKIKQLLIERVGMYHITPKEMLSPMRFM
ncbi:TIGR03960 family B12-binding radical SAM protein [candidate division TA06 bacterium]|uniref:TIGR03960 family B12-binding radical SAM protein n=1 Tax=candidate division TA06 bacterium TaxID=2250710 RepID=A0A933IA03_UNCT6|nr:TIGR03960 family B12-binding radical SAM protein [candidate division TA06 bacterium]